jgi:hypothetical protein
MLGFYQLIFIKILQLLQHLENYNHLGGSWDSPVGIATTKVRFPILFSTGS